MPSEFRRKFSSLKQRSLNHWFEQANENRHSWCMEDEQNSVAIFNIQNAQAQHNYGSFSLWRFYGHCVFLDVQIIVVPSFH